MHRLHSPQPVANLAAPALAMAIAAVALGGGSTPGDECATALPAVAGTNGPVNMLSMLGSSDIPANGSCAYLNWTSATRDAWWKFDCPIDGGIISLDFCPSNYDTSVVIYEGECGALTRVACDDDSCAPAGPTYQSRIRDLPVSGGSVYIRVGGYGGAAGIAQFSLGFVSQGWVRQFGPAAFPYPAPSDLSPAVAVDCAHNHALAVKPDGSVRAWGFNYFGQSDVPADLGAVQAVAAGTFHSMALRRDGIVRAWGRNWYGEGSVPADLGTATAIDAGAEYCAALTAAGTVRVWGGNYGDVQSVPSGLGAVRAIAAGGNHMLAIRGDGTVAAWGYNGVGATSVPADLGTVTAIAAGDGHSLALKPDGSLRGWGNNAHGQRTAPADLGPVVKVVAGGYVTTTVDAHGKVRSWGRHEVGGTLLAPIVPADLGPSVALSTSDEFTIAVTQTNPCPGDVDLTGKVDGADLGSLLNSWGPAPAGASTDTNQDGVVNGADLGALLANWGPCG